MKLLTVCMECQRELGHPSFEPIICDYYDDAFAEIKCARGHTSAVMLQSQKFEILLESAAEAFLDGYTIEAASSLSAAYERFFEFAIKVFCEKFSLSTESIDATFKQVAKQSERQIGAFLFLYNIIFSKPYSLSTKIPPLRNGVIHQGYIPTPIEVMELGELIYQEIYSISKLLREQLDAEVQKVVVNTVRRRNAKIPDGMPRATSTGTMLFALANALNKETFAEALENYKQARQMAKLFQTGIHLTNASHTTQNWDWPSGMPKT